MKTTLFIILATLLFLTTDYISSQSKGKSYNEIKNSSAQKDLASPDKHKIENLNSIKKSEYKQSKSVDAEISRKEFNSELETAKRAIYIDNNSSSFNIKQIKDLSNTEISFSSQIFPNPFNPKANIKFDLPKTSLTKLIIYDAMGREIDVLINEELIAGSYQVDWDGSGYPSGVYFYRLETDEFVDTKKMLLIK